MTGKRTGPTEPELAQAAGISVRHVRKDKALGATHQTIEEYLDWRARNRRPRSPNVSGTLGTETARLRAAQARLAELDAARRAGILAPVDEYQIAINEAMVLLSTQLDGLPGRC